MFVVEKNNDNKFTFDDRSVLLQKTKSIVTSLSPFADHAHISAKALSGQRSPTRLVNTSRLWLTGRPLGSREAAKHKKKPLPGKLLEEAKVSIGN